MQSKKPVTVYLRWPERDLLALAPLVRLVWKSLIDELTPTPTTTATVTTAVRFYFWLMKRAGRLFQPWLRPLQRLTDGGYPFG